MSTDLIDRARSGDAVAFEQLVGPYRREMQVHCYRILGSVADAEDALQETLTAAWRALGGYQGRAGIRTWLYRIATSRCLNMLRAASRRPQARPPALDFEPPEPTRLGEVVWLEPYPDVLFDLPDGAAGPEARCETREAISLAFVTALQLLPPRQRAALILRDVLDFSVREVAGLLGTTEQSAASALKRARATLARELPSPERPAQTDSPAERDLLGRLVRAFEAGDVDGLDVSGREVAGLLDTTEQSVASAVKRARATLARELPSPDQPAPAPGSPREQELVSRLVRAFEAGDVDGIVALMTGDVWLRMPPVPLEYQGRELARRFFSDVAFRRGRRYLLVPTRANGQPAFGVYLRDPLTGVGHASGLVVITLAGEQVSAITRFDSGVLSRFGLPRTLPGIR